MHTRLTFPALLDDHGERRWLVAAGACDQRISAHEWSNWKARLPDCAQRKHLFGNSYVHARARHAYTGGLCVPSDFWPPIVMLQLSARAALTFSACCKR